MTESNRAAMEGFLAAYAARDGAGQFSRMADDVEIHEPDGLPYGGIWRGHDGWRQLARKINETWELEGNLHERRIFGNENDEQFVLSTRLTGKSRKTGERFDMTVLEIWTIIDGKIRSLKPHYFDTLTAARINGDL